MNDVIEIKTDPNKLNILIIHLCSFQLCEAVSTDQRSLKFFRLPTLYLLLLIVCLTMMMFSESFVVVHKGLSIVKKSFEALKRNLQKTRIDLVKRFLFSLSFWWI